MSNFADVGGQIDQVLKDVLAIKETAKDAVLGFLIFYIVTQLFVIYAACNRRCGCRHHRDGVDKAK